MRLIFSRMINYLIIIVLLATGSKVFADFQKEYEGRVVQIVEEEGSGNLKTSSYLKFPGKAGSWVLWIIQPGVFVKEGTLLVHTDPTYVKIDIEKAKARVKMQYYILQESKSDLDRCNRLVKSGGVSIEDKEAAEEKYYNSMLDYEQAKKDLKKSELDLEYVDIKAPYDCYVAKAYAKVASSSDIDFPVLKIIRLSPLYIDVKLDRALAKRIYNQEIGVSVYPAGKDKSVGVYNEKIKLTENGIKIPVRNYILDDVNNDNIPFVHEIGFVSLYNETLPTGSKGELGILAGSFYKEKGKAYVWKAVGQKGLKPGKTIAEEFSIEKVFVEKTEDSREGFDGKLCKIKKTDKLEADDVLINNAPKGLKNGDKVIYKRKVCLFWPGDKVKVVLNELNK